MHITGKSIRSITKLVAAAHGKTSIRLARKVDQNIMPLLVDLGFDSELVTGDFLIPRPVGKVTFANSQGDIKVRKDLPKEPESVSVYTSWQDWHGRPHSGVVSRTIKKYPRDYIPAQELSLGIVQLDGDKFVATDIINLNEEKMSLHASNLMLECFGGFDLVDAENEAIVGPKVKQLHWDVLPPGEYPWSRAKGLIGEATKHLEEKDRKVIESRIQSITRFSPDFVATGRAGFTGYFVFGFKKKGLYCLESIYLDNATYIFGEDWEKLSKLTKNQIINGDVEHTRIIHDKCWGREIRRVFSKF